MNMPSMSPITGKEKGAEGYLSQAPVALRGHTATRVSNADAYLKHVLPQVYLQ